MRKRQNPAFCPKCHRLRGESSVGKSCICNQIEAEKIVGEEPYLPLSERQRLGIDEDTYQKRSEEWRNKLQPHLMKYQHIDEPDLKKMPDSFCDCSTCREMCDRACWPTPQEALALIEAGYSNQLMLDYWQSDDLLGHTEILCPASPGTEKRAADWFPARGCVLNKNGLCAIHGKLKSIEARKAHHSDTPPGLHYAVAKSWDSDEGRRIIQIWKKLVNFND